MNRDEHPDGGVPRALDEEATGTRAVAFPDDHGHIREEKVQHGHARPRGPEMKREMTKEDMELAAAGYEHLNEERPKGKKGDDQLDGVDITEHQLTFQELSLALDAALDTKDPGNSYGLTTAEANARLARDGPNVLTPPKKKSAWRMYIDILLTMFNILLIVAGVLEYILLGVNFKENFANTYLGGILIAVAFLNAFIEFFQLQKSEAILASFLAMIPPSCRVIRDGSIVSIPAGELVKGDIVLLRSGDKTPADLVLFASTDLKVDNSSLTGESEPQERLCRPEGSKARPAEADNLVFNSTLIVNGEGWGVVVRTGDHTLIGQIAALTGGETGNKSPLAVEIGRFVLMVSTIAITFAIVFFVVGITTVYKGAAAQTVTFAVSILVAFVPEGLPSVVTLLLSIAAKRMATQNVLVKDLQGVETLGSLTLLATDKTGTLTRNQMTVTNLWSGRRMYTAFQSNNDSESTEAFSISTPGMREMVEISALNSRVKFDKTDIPFEQRTILGDATETGLTRFAGRHIADYDALHKQHPKVFEIPFNSSNKWALVILDKPHTDGSLTLYIKGAPERVLAKCSTYLKDGKAEPITDDFKQAYDEAYNYMASRGHRVIACAQMLLPSDPYDASYPFSKNDGHYPGEDYCFCGLISLEDPPKHGVREAIGTLRLAGIKVMMVTGDHPKTAEAIARKINLILGDTKETMSAKTGRPVEEIYEDEVEAVVVHGDDIDGLQGWQWDQIFAKNEIVFARTSPQHKLEIVKRAQALGHIVGVTGDGVNDSPALKKADLGIAMNISGSDVSKEAANMILLDDNFASTVKGVAEGRQIFVNLKRSIQYTITHITPEVIPQLLYVVVPIPLPLSAILILVIDLGFELFVALSFAWDKPETKDGLMRMPPRKPVNERSILSLKRRALRRSKTIRQYGSDIETQVPNRPSRLSALFAKVKAPFTREFWEDLFERTDDEKLVDGKLLSYSYLEAGMIETIGALVAYFVVFYKSGFTPADLRTAQQSSTTYFEKSSPDFTNSRGQVISASQQVEAFGKAQSIVYLAIFIMQCFNVFAVKARFTFPFGRSTIGNPYNFLGILGGACLGVFIIYTPPLHVVFGGSYHLSPLYWLIPAAFGVLLLGWTCVRVLLLRRGLQQSRLKDIKGLMMFPTMRTMSMRSKH
ncbi:aminophospholipid-transporting P-type ATPase [Wolfiporia cocos MD-104 SS10]|uniref:Aminophospholipid-transporting P-type ATPase n=1 Tax=Wolfiporia cocos (strain MD-104) TaxID=742152 RepID=A0A2H3JPL8_WOLCO|nr:aminophospholipid-transporting P-type ATPase [Wolfiporia cocos MD-104 SS10]